MKNIYVNILTKNYKDFITNNFYILSDINIISDFLEKRNKSILMEKELN